MVRSGDKGLMTQKMLLYIYIYTHMYITKNGTWCNQDYKV